MPQFSLPNVRGWKKKASWGRRFALQRKESRTRLFLAGCPFCLHPLAFVSRAHSHVHTFSTFFFFWLFWVLRSLKQTPGFLVKKAVSLLLLHFRSLLLHTFNYSNIWLVFETNRILNAWKTSPSRRSHLWGSSRGGESEHESFSNSWKLFENSLCRSSTGGYVALLFFL